MLEPQGKIKTRDFLKHIEFLGQSSSGRIIGAFQKKEKELINKFIADTSELIEHNEWVIGLENILTNIYEIEFALDKKAVQLAKAAIVECGLEYGDWNFIEELVNEGT